MTFQKFIYSPIEEERYLKSLFSGILNPIEEVSDMDQIKLYDYMDWGNYNSKMQDLANKAIKEEWSFSGKQDYAILKNYIDNTFQRLRKENKIVETDTYCAFNTGLYTPYYSPIYVYGEKHEKQLNKKWFFKDFKDEYDLGAMDIEEKFPERADYFEDTSRLVFDWHCKVNINYNHILSTMHTFKRLPESFKNSTKQLELLKGVVDTAINKIIANYKLAVPSIYKDKIQLMIPLCFEESNKPDVALILDKKKGNYYQATTCLTMEMAYMDARLIAKPESNWLIAENIQETETTE